MNSIYKFLSCLLCLLLSCGPAWPCTTFILKGKGRIYFGRNLDWFWEDGLVLVNQRGVQKTAFLMAPGTPVKWQSKYGSVTFNQFGRELPFGGMNEAGLVVENMWLYETEFPAADGRSAINLLQWIQYQLDTCRTVAEVLATESKLRVETPPPNLREMGRIHYLICDAKGDCATIEFLNGKTVVHHRETLPCPALANSTYDASMKAMRTAPATVNAASNGDANSLARFSHAATRAQSYRPSKPFEEKQYAFETLDQVKQGDFTVWQVVYDLKARSIQFRTRSTPEQRTLSLKDLDFSPKHPVQFVDIHAKPSGGRWQFQDLTEAAHLQYLQTFIKQDSVKKQFGDISPLLAGLTTTLRSYTAQ